MKGFPNQVAELTKISTAVRTLAELVAAGDDAKDDGVYGVALVRTGVAGTGHTPKPIDQYLREQRQKEPSNQSFRTTARGLRELFRLFGFIDDGGRRVFLTDLGRQAASRPFDAAQIEFWRAVIRNIVHSGGGTESHPYQVLLRLVARKPGITRAKCALALEARDDSPAELDRIVALVDLPEEEIRKRIGVSRSNWDNAKKVLPKFAEQLGDVVRRGDSYSLAAGPGSGTARTKPAPVARRPRGAPAERVAEPRPAQAAAASKRARSGRIVTPETIATLRQVDEFKDVELPDTRDPEDLRKAIEKRNDRFRRHQLLVQALGRRLGASATEIREYPYDILALVREIGLMGEVKTLDGTPEDEVERVRDALSQLLYYEAFAIAEDGPDTIHKFACFEREIMKGHQEWLNRSGIATIWCGRERDTFEGDELATRLLARYLQELA